MSPEKITDLDPVIHSRVRLAVLSILIASEAVEFGYLREVTGTTDGNLSTHLARLEQSGLVSIRKLFVGKKPLTTVSITNQGRDAFAKYVKTLEQVLQLGKGR